MDFFMPLSGRKNRIRSLPPEMRGTINWGSLSAGAVGIPGAFAFQGDLPILAGIWIAMLVRLARQAGKPIDKETAAKIIAGVLTGIGLYKAGFKLADKYFVYTGVGTIPAVIANAGTNSVVTFLFGRATAEVLLSELAERSVEDIVKAILESMAGFASNGNNSVKS